MTRDETKKCIEVMQAYVDGRDIEIVGTCRPNETNNDLHWNWGNHATGVFTPYKIKE